MTLSRTTIIATGNGGHAVMVTQGGTMTLTDVNMSTAGGSASAIATDRGGGNISVTGGTVSTSGQNSAGLYSTGTLNASGTTFKSTGAEMAVIEGANSITLTNVQMTSTREKWGVMIYQSMSGDASGSQGTFTMTGGSLNYTPVSGPLFYVNNSTGIINLKVVSLTAGSGLLLKAAAGDWGKSGSNGGTAVLTADGQLLNGDMEADSISSIAVTLKNSSTLTGKLTGASITLDATSIWNVTGNSALTSFTASAGISGASIANVKGNGFAVTYDPGLSANSYLGARTYDLAGGGTLAPRTASTGAKAPAISPGGILNAASGSAGITPGAWISIYGANLSTAAVSATAADIRDNYLPTTLGGTKVTINGKSAYLNYVSPTQLNVQAPDDSATGNVSVTVSNSSGTAAATVIMQEAMPGLFAAANYVLAVRAGDGVLINGTGAPAAGYTTTAAARPGDVLQIFGTGLGATTAGVPSGLVFSGAYPTTRTPSVTIAGTPAAVSYCGLIGAGLYQINLTVPTGLAAGTYPVIVTQGTASSPSTPVIKIVAN